MKFTELPLSEPLLATLNQLEYSEMTPIQASSLPLTLAGDDLIAQAKTGSGKTAAFALPLLMRLKPRLFAAQALVLCPTRELAEQVAQEIRRLARGLDNIKILTLCGGSPIRGQVSSLEHGAHVVVGTPGRLMDHISRGHLKLDSLNTLVLDEADRMLDMGFFEDIAWVASQCPTERQTLLFSATYPDGISRLAAQFLREPKDIRLAEQHEAEKIRQRFYEITPDQRLAATGALLRHYRPISTLAFCNTRQQCRDLVTELQAQGFEVLTLHGELEQYERDQVLIRFANRSCSVLVATDVAARGLDISQLEAVINVDITPDPEIHVHRIGRTGRADGDGWALSLAATADRKKIDAISRFANIEPEWHTLNSLDEDSAPLIPPMTSLLIQGGRKEKIRPADILGALTGEGGLTREQVGKINVTDLWSYVAVDRTVAKETEQRLNTGKIKGKSRRVRSL